MIHTPNVIANCDKCRRSITETGWKTSQEFVESIQSRGWQVGKATGPNAPIPAVCPECAKQ